MTSEFEAQYPLRNRRRLIAAGVAGVLVLAFAGWYVVRITRDGPSDVVRSYLTALRDRKVATAVKIAGLRRPTGDDGTFLNAKTLTGGWRIKSLTEETSDPGDDKKTADVDVTLANTTKGAVGNPEANSGTFHLILRGGAWQITNPLVEVRFLNSPLWYVEVGSLRKERTSYPKIESTATEATKTDDRPVTLLFPGIYTPYEHSSTEMVAVTPARLIVLPDSDEPLTYSPAVKPSERLLSMAQDNARTFVDRCVTDMATGGTDCGPVVSNDHFRTSTDTLSGYEVKTRSWRLTRYPTIGFLGWTVKPDNGLYAFASQVAVPGEFQLTASGTKSSSTKATIAQSCLTTSFRNEWGTTVGINVDGTAVVSWTSPSLSQSYKHASTKTWFMAVCFGDEGY